MPQPSEKCNNLRTNLPRVRKMYHISDMAILAQGTDLRSRLLARIASKPDEVRTPGDFADLGGRAAIDKTLQRLAIAGELRRIDRGLYDRPRKNELTGRSTVPDYRAVSHATASPYLC
jgi:predicted transcriptional regulator of viral defense system